MYICNIVRRSGWSRRPKTVPIPVRVAPIQGRTYDVDSVSKRVYVKTLQPVSYFTYSQPIACFLGREYAVILCPASLNATEEVSHEVPHNKDLMTSNTNSSLMEDAVSVRSKYSVMATPGDSYELAKACAIPREIITHNWIAGDTMTSYNLAGLWSTLPAVINFLKRQVVRWRGKPRLRVSYTGNPSYVGMMRVCAVPIRAQDFDGYSAPPGGIDDVRYSWTKMSGYPHIDLDVSISCTCELELPYLYQEDFGYDGSGDFDYSIYLVPLHQLVTVNGTAVLPVVMRIYAWYDDVETQGLKPQGGDSEPGLVSSGLRWISRASASYSSPFSKVASLGAVIAEAMGYSRLPTATMESMISRKVGQMSDMSGATSQAYALTTDTRELFTMESTHLPDPFGSVDELARRWSHLEYEMVFGSYYPLDPMRMVHDLGFHYYYPTTLAVATIPFRYWRGSLKYKLVFYASPFVRGRVCINITNPKTSLLHIPTVDGTAITHYVDITGSTTFEFTLPYLYSNKFKYVSLGVDDASDSSYPRIVLSWVSGPQGPIAVTPTVYTDMWVSAGDDYEVGVPSLENLNTLTQAQGKFEETYGNQPKSLVELAKRSVPCASLALPATNVGVNLYTATFPADGIIPCKFTPYAYGTVTTPFNAMNVNKLSWSYMTYAMSLAYGYSGSSVWRIFPYYATDGTDVLNKLPAAGSMTVGLNYQPIQAGYEAPLSPMCTDMAVGDGYQYFQGDTFPEVSLPSRLSTQYKYTPFIDNGAGSAAVVRQVFSMAQYNFKASPLALAYQLSHSASDDFMIGFYMPPTWATYI